MEKKSVLTGKVIDESQGYVEDADGNYYAADEYSIEVDKTTD